MKTVWRPRGDRVETVWRRLAADLNSAATHRRQPLSGRMAMLNTAHLLCIIEVNPVIGLTGSHMEQARAWLDDLHR